MEMRILDWLGLFNVRKEFASHTQEFSQYIVSFVGFVQICFFTHIEEIFLSGLFRLSFQYILVNFSIG